MSHKEIIKLALSEDLYPLGDLTSNLLVSPFKLGAAKIIAKEKGILACSNILVEVLQAFCELMEVPESGEINFLVADGKSFEVGDEIANFTTPAQVILGAERTILNFLQRSCGIATKTKSLVEKIEAYNCQLLDTRKTIPGLRNFEKEAFGWGGGTRHRYNLSDMVLIKENHLKFMEDEEGNLLQKLRLCRAKLEEISSKELQQDGSPKIKMEIEINEDNLGLLDSVLESPVDIIMLDNFEPGKASEIIEKIRSANAEIKIELSGGINSDSIASYAQTGCDYISTGSVYTDVRNCDLSMLIS